MRINGFDFYAFLQSCNIDIDNQRMLWYTNARRLKLKCLQLYKSKKSCYNQEELILSSSGESVISYADYAIAMIDEVVNGDHIGRRISVVKE